MTKKNENIFATLEKEVSEAINKKLPIIIAAKAVSMFKENFREESFFGEKWQDVIRRNGKVYFYIGKRGKTLERKVKPAKGAKGKLPILTQTGDLGRSIKYKITGLKIIIYSDLPYSAIHNEGGFAGRNNNSEIPKRQFIGNHEKLEKAINETIEKFIKQALK